MTLITFLFLFIFTSFIFFVIGGFLYLIYLPIKLSLIKKGTLSKLISKRINVAYVSSLLLASAYLTYDAIYPGEDFYKDEFKRVTLRELPESAHFIAKSADYPDFHGDYCSSSQIMLSKDDYNKLLHEIITDKRIDKDSATWSFDAFNKTLQDKSTDNFVYRFERSIGIPDDHHLGIYFCNDGQTIFVNVCVT